ncbi:unnamed protein product [Linum tenue]|nr:unnamed protein product [Linum tenue]
MLRNDSIHEMYTRFTMLINKLIELGRTFQSKELNRKILRSLPKEWLAKLTIIEEVKNPRNLPTNKLIVSLLSHEHVVRQVIQEDEKRKKNLAFNRDSLATFLIVNLKVILIRNSH